VRFSRNMESNTTNGICGIEIPIGRAFSPLESFWVVTWGVAPGWYVVAPSALISWAGRRVASMEHRAVCPVPIGHVGLTSNEWVSLSLTFAGLFA